MGSDRVLYTQGKVADDGTTPANPVVTGGLAKSFDGTDPGNISAENDVAQFITDLNRRQYVSTVHPRMWSYHEDSSSALTDAVVQASAGAGYSHFITDIVCSTGAATAMNIFFEEGSTKILGPYYLETVAGRGLGFHFTTPKRITASPLEGGWWPQSNRNIRINVLKQCIKETNPKTKK